MKRLLFGKSHIKNKGPIYTRQDKFGTGPRLGPDRPCIHMGPPGTDTMWVH